MLFLWIFLEDVSGDAVDYRDGMLAIFDEISAKFSEIGLATPRFFSFLNAGFWTIYRLMFWRGNGNCHGVTRSMTWFLSHRSCCNGFMQRSFDMNAL